MSYKNTVAMIASETDLSKKAVDKVLKALGPCIEHHIKFQEYFCIPKVMSGIPRNDAGVTYKFGKDVEYPSTRPLRLVFRISDSLLDKSNGL